MRPMSNTPSPQAMARRPISYAPCRRSSCWRAKYRSKVAWYWRGNLRVRLSMVCVNITCDEYEGIIRAFKIPLQNQVGHLLRRSAACQSLTEPIPQPVGRENQHVVWSNGQVGGAQFGQVIADNAVAQHNAGACRL